MPATSISSHAATIEVDIEEAMQKYGIDADWTAGGLALYTQACKGPSFLQRPKAALTLLLPASITCTDIEMLFGKLYPGRPIHDREQDASV